MKKLSIVLVLSLLLLNCFAVAADYDTKKIQAIKGTPVIDGEMDEIWQGANVMEANLVNQTLIPSETKTTGKAWTMWDENYFYILAEVYKSAVYPEGGEAENVDSVEYGIDFLNTKGSNNVAPGGDDTAGVFRIGTNDSQISGFGGAFDAVQDKIVGKCVTTDFGYRAELAIPWVGIAPAEGKVISMEVQINVNDNGTGRDGLVTWNSDECLGWRDSESHGEVTLAAAPVVAEPETEPPAPATEEPAAAVEPPAETPPPPVAPVTGDFAAIFALMLLACAAAAYTVLRKIKN